MGNVALIVILLTALGVTLALSGLAIYAGIQALKHKFGNHHNP